MNAIELKNVSFSYDGKKKILSDVHFVAEYGKVKSLLTERNIEFTDDGQKIDAVIPSMYADKFTSYITQRNHL